MQDVQQIEIFFLIFSQKTGFDISCKLSRQSLFPGEKKKEINIINLLSAELAQRVVKVKGIGLNIILFL